MTKKEMLLRALEGKSTPRPLSSPHWWGMYKFQLAGVCDDYDREGEAWAIGGEALYQIDKLFYETFQPDQFHLSCGPSRLVRDEKWRAEEGRLLKQMRLLQSERDIDAYFDHVFLNAAQIVASGVYDHVPYLVRDYGEDVLILMNEGNPVCGVFDPHGLLGFESGLIALVEKPERVAYLCQRYYADALERVKALKSLGAHGYIGSETYCACDLLSPATIRAVILPAIRAFYQALRAMDMVGVVYYLGDVEPIIDDIAGLGARAIMVEEGKKGFQVDVGRLYRRLEGRCALYGNVDGVYEVLMGTPQGVAEACKRQLDACGDGFIAASGSPICFNTPKENIWAFRTAVGEGGDKSWRHG